LVFDSILHASRTQPDVNDATADGVFGGVLGTI